MLLDDYLELHREYKTKYGELTILFMQVGSFYEAYSLDNVEPDLSIISDILNIVYTRKDKSKSDSPYMLGFPTPALHKFIRLLIQKNYTTVIYKQTIENSENSLNRDLVTRSLEAIYTPATYLEDLNTVTNFMCGIYIDSSGYKTDTVYHCGLTLIDLSTGDLLFLEDHFKTTDALVTYLLNINCEIRPKEYILFQISDELSEINTTTNNQLTSCGKKITRIYNNNRQIEKITYQTEFFQRIYIKQLSLLPIIEQLDLHQYNFARLSVILTLDFCYQLNDRIINFIKTPKLYRNNSLVLGNQAISQLNILDNNSLSVLTNDYKSVYDVVNNCSTAMGKRLLYKRLTEPFTDPIVIKKYYDLSQIISNYKDTTINYLKNIKDIERLSRRVLTSNISPAEFYNLYTSLQSVLEMLNLVVNKFEEEYIEYLSQLITVDVEDIISNLNKFLSVVRNTVNIDSLIFYNSIKDIKTNIFVNNSELDKLENSLNVDKNIYETTALEFAKLLNEKRSPQLEIKDNKEGKHIYTTLIRGDKIKKTLQETNPSSLDNYTFVMLNKNCKIYINNIGSTDYNTIQDQFLTRLRKYYLDFLTELSVYSEYFYHWSNSVAIIDFLINNCILEERWGYCKPELKEKNKINTKALRHPLIERIINTEYIPNDIDLNDNSYMLLFGINSSGKSSLQKSLGIALILAQSGCYVPADSFEYSPYRKLYVRISGSDNIFKGQSSFVVEMNELKSILDNLGPETLVISDEMARGSETTSSISIVAAAIIQLVKHETSFISATHFNEILKFDEIKTLPLSIYHLSVSIDDKGIIVYERKLKPGKCSDNYGTLVAGSIIKSTEFNRLTEQFSRKIKEEQQYVISGRTSRYNSEVFVDSCIKCGSIQDLHTHHIIEQQDCDKHKAKTKKNIQKNSKANLIVLCEECHQMVHRMNLEINKVTTTEGIKVTIK